MTRAASPPRPPAPRRPSGLAFWSPLVRHGALVRSLAWRQIGLRYRGSVFGWMWSVLTPLIMLGVYTFVFTVIFKRHWDGHAAETTSYALYLYLGLICHQYLSECISRAPGLVAENRTFVKKIIFPLEALSWVSALAAAFTLGINLVILAALNLAWYGPPPPQAALLLPLALGPLVMLGLGFSWLFAALGVYLRDLRQISGLIVSVFLFATPIFYPLDAVPQPYATWLLAVNPLAGIVTLAREALFDGAIGSWALVGGLWAGTGAFAALASAFFLRLRKGFSDVI